MIRDAQPGDAQAITAIWNAVIEDTAFTFTTQIKSVKDVSTLIAQRPVLVVQAGPELIGFATFGPFRNGPGYRFVAEHSIYLARAQQRSGQGRALLIALEARAQQQGIDTLVAGIGGENPGAQAFHRAMGYTQVGHLPGLGEKFGRRHDLVFLQKTLA